MFIGLILLLMVYLVRGRRAKANAAADPMSSTKKPTGGRGSIRPPKKPKRSSPVPAPPLPASQTVSMPLSTPAAEPTPFPRPAPSIIEQAPEWAPEEPIIEPGWPIPGEISGGWSPAPETASPARFLDGAAAQPLPVVEWAPSADSDAPEAAPVADVPADADPASAGPPLWVPGEAVADDSPETALESAGGEPIWLSEPCADEATALEEAAVAVWQPETTEIADPPPIAWAADDASTEEQPIWLADPSADETGSADAQDGDSAPSPLAWAVDTPSTNGSEPDPIVPDAEPLQAEAAEEPLAAWTEPAIIVQHEYAEMAPAPIHESEPEAPLGEQSAAVAGLVPALLDGLVPFTRVCDRLGVTPRMLALMRIIGDTALSVTELARHLGVSRPLVAELCTRLENLGLAKREPVETNKRRIRMVLTEAGRKLSADSVASPEQTAVEAILSGLTPAERAQLLRGLKALAGTPA